MVFGRVHTKSMMPPIIQAASASSLFEIYIECRSSSGLLIQGLEAVRIKIARQSCDHQNSTPVLRSIDLRRKRGAAIDEPILLTELYLSLKLIGSPGPLGESGSTNLLGSMWLSKPLAAAANDFPSVADSLGPGTCFDCTCASWLPGGKRASLSGTTVENVHR